jgi:hypothetical protein
LANVDKVHTRSYDAHRRLTRARRFEGRDLLEFQHFGSTLFFHSNGFHNMPLTVEEIYLVNDYNSLLELRLSFFLRMHDRPRSKGYQPDSVGISSQEFFPRSASG